MNGVTQDKALERIEAALARIENAANQAAAERTRLKASHDRLKATVSEALEDLDGLIKGAQR